MRLSRQSGTRVYESAIRSELGFHLMPRPDHCACQSCGDEGKTGGSAPQVPEETAGRASLSCALFVFTQLYCRPSTPSNQAFEQRAIETKKSGRK